ncbi:MAG: hypothetical protein KAR06_12075 [Deltaproteobacteria bacterium]|nr:hypothetical protein [Deltaproteobacteria bacterium]
MIGQQVTAEFITAFTRRYVKKPIPTKARQMYEPFWVESLEGNHQGKAGDWLMEGINGELYICAEDIFAKTYEEVKP